MHLATSLSLYTCQCEFNLRKASCYYSVNKSGSNRKIHLFEQKSYSNDKNLMRNKLKTTSEQLISKSQADNIEDSSNGSMLASVIFRPNCDLESF